MLRCFPSLKRPNFYVRRLRLASQGDALPAGGFFLPPERNQRPPRAFPPQNPPGVRDWECVKATFGPLPLLWLLVLPPHQATLGSWPYGWVVSLSGPTLEKRCLSHRQTQCLPPGGRWPGVSRVGGRLKQRPKGFDARGGVYRGGREVRERSMLCANLRAYRPNAPSVTCGDSSLPEGAKRALFSYTPHIEISRKMEYNTTVSVRKRGE